MVSAVVLITFTLLGVGPDSATFEPGKPMVITAGNDVGWQVTNPEAARQAFLERGELRCGPENMEAHWERSGAMYAEHGVTAFEPYVKWMLLEPEEGVWDPAFYDAELNVFKKHGLKWVPFLIAGPAYATPPWFKESVESVFAVDLKTGAVTRDQSIWNPHLRPRVRAWLARFFGHYDQKDMQAVLLGISGVFGESIYTAGGNEWTQIWDGEYPQHLGWWCGDQYAKADFVKSMREKYQDITSLNKAWDTDIESFDDVSPFVPDDSQSMRARLDFVRWYMGSMTDYAEWWVATTRELAPDVPVLLCTGGGGDSQLGADMTAQSKMVARHGAGIRITNEASDYATNFYLTRIVGTACRHYGTYFGYEPAGAVDTRGIVARIYNAVASGAWELFHYDNPPQGERGEPYKQYSKLMLIREPVIEVGFFWSRTSADLNLQRGRTRLAHDIRDLSDVAYVDEQLIADGVLAGLKVLVWGSGPVTEADTARAIQRAVENGMTLVVPKGWQVTSPEGDTLFPSAFTTHPDNSGTAASSGLPSTPAAIRIGDGAIIQSASTRAESVAALLAALIREPGGFGVSGLSPEASVDAQSDEVYVSVTTRDILLYNHGDKTHTVSMPSGPVEVPAQAIVSVPR